MSGLKRWSIPTWIFFHTFAAKINEKFYIKNRKMVLFIIKIICRNLPCSECSKHASIFMENVNIHNVKTKQDFIKMLWTFHNSVNKRTGKKTFKEENLGKYNNFRMDYAFINFINNYSTRFGFLTGGVMTNLFTRRNISKNLTNWMRTNWKYFQ